MIIYLGHHKEFLCWHFKHLPFIIPFTLNSVAKTKLSCYSFPLTQHHSFLRNLAPFIWSIWLTLVKVVMSRNACSNKNGKNSSNCQMDWVDFPLINLTKICQFRRADFVLTNLPKNWPKSSNPLTFTQFDKIWSNLPFLFLCEFLDISEDWWNVSCSPQLKIILHWATLNWIGFITIYFFFWSW